MWYGIFNKRLLQAVLIFPEVRGRATIKTSDPWKVDEFDLMACPGF